MDETVTIDDIREIRNGVGNIKENFHFVNY